MDNQLLKGRVALVTGGTTGWPSAMPAIVKAKELFAAAKPGRV